MQIDGGRSKKELWLSQIKYALKVLHIFNIENLKGGTDSASNINPIDE